MKRRERLAQAKKFMLHYGREQLASLLKTHIAIVDPAGYNDGEIKKLQEAQILVFSYLSVVEVPPGSEVFTLLQGEDFILNNGDPLLNQEFGNWVADLASPRWQGLLMHQAANLLGRRGFDGLFLDTIGFLESHLFSPLLRQQQLASVGEFLQRIRRVFPDRLFVQNSGMFEALEQTHPYLDGICWENPPLEHPESWIPALIQRLKSYRSASGLEIFLLLENQDPQNHRSQKALEIARANGFRLYNAQTGYTGEIAPQHMEE